MKFEELGKKVIYFGIGLAAYTKEKIEEMVNELVKEGEVKQKEAAQLKEKLIVKAEEEKKELLDFIRAQVNNVAKELGFVTKDEIEKLKKQIKKLEKELSEKKDQK